MQFIERRDDLSEKMRYDYTDYPIYIRRALLSSYPDHSALMHWHDDIEFIAVLSGEMQYNINGEIINLSENEGVFVNARQMHFGFSTAKKECDFICVLLHPQLLCAVDAFERDFVLPILHSRKATYIKLTADISWQNAILDSLITMYAEKDSRTAALKIQNLFSLIWIRLYENIQPDSQPEMQNGDLAVLKKMIGFIRQNYTGSVTLSAIAASGAVGQSKCCKLFSKLSGRTPNLYLTEYRLHKSVALLKNTDMSVTEIAAAVGFNSSSYYAETFRKRYGKSPTAYRKINALNRR